jgi:CheY-like chemotaxis protein
VIRLPLSAAAAQEAAGGNRAATAVAPQRVLVIEDNHDVAETLASYLEHVGYEVVVAHDGIAGVEAALRHRPRVVICDIGLPRIDGYEITARLRREAEFQSCLMIALTGYGDVEDRARARRAGFAHHFTKPVDRVRVADAMASAAEAARPSDAAG